MEILDPAPVLPPGAPEEVTHFPSSVVQPHCKRTTHTYGYVRSITYYVQPWQSAKVQPGYPCSPAHGANQISSTLRWSEWRRNSNTQICQTHVEADWSIPRTPKSHATLTQNLLTNTHGNLRCMVLPTCAGQHVQLRHTRTNMIFNVFLARPSLCTTLQEHSPRHWTL